MKWTFTVSACPLNVLPSLPALQEECHQWPPTLSLQVQILLHHVNDDMFKLASERTQEDLIKDNNMVLFGLPSLDSK